MGWASVRGKGACLSGKLSGKLQPLRPAKCLLPAMAILVRRAKWLLGRREERRQIVDDQVDVARALGHLGEPDGLRGCREARGHAGSPHAAPSRLVDRWYCLGPLLWRARVHYCIGAVSMHWYMAPSQALAVAVARS